MLHLIPRHLWKALVAPAIALALVATLGSPAIAKQDPEVKRVKKELVRLESMHDVSLKELNRLGKRWDELEALSSQGPVGFSSFLGGALGVVERSHVEMAMLHARAAIQSVEDERSRAIRRLERIVAKKQRAKFANSGMSPALMPSLNVGGSLITYSADWEKTAMCESTKRWHIDSRYDGGLQFDPITWIEFGGAEFARYAYQATKLEQIAVAERVLVIQGPGAWPICFTPLPVDAEG